MKILKHKNLMGLIYSALLCMPLLAIGVRSAYVICNKNAYQSYSNQYVETSTQVQNQNQLITDMNYVATYESKENESTTYGMWIQYKSISINWVDYGFQANNYTKFRLFNTGRIQLQIADGTQYDLTNVWGNTLKQFSFVFDSVYQGFNLNGDVNYTLLTYTQDKLDNVFEYSVNKFVSENNLGRINLFSWFTNLFLSDNATNNLYVGFANWYMNYVMLISCMHLLFLVLMWFVNYSRRLLDRGMNYDW